MKSWAKLCAGRMKILEETYSDVWKMLLLFWVITMFFKKRRKKHTL